MKRDYDIRWYFIFSNIKNENESYNKTDSCEINLSVGLLKVLIHLGMKFKKDFLKEIEESISKYSYFHCEEKKNLKNYLLI